MFFFRSSMLMLFGLGVGTVGTMLGVGGGWLHVPFFMLVFHFSPQMAIGTSIGIIFFNTLSGSIIYFVQKRMDYDLAKRLAPAVLPGALLGPFIVNSFKSSFFFAAFAAVLVLIAVSLLSKKARLDHPEGLVPAVAGGRGAYVGTRRTAASVRLGMAGTLVIGFLSNLFGIGGGIIHVPFLILVMKIPTHIALGTSHLLLCVSSFFGAAVYFAFGHAQIDFMMPVAAGTILGARFGAELARIVDESLIRRSLAVLLLMLAFRMAYAAF